MEKLTDKIAALPPDANYVSFEFFPPKTQIVGFLLSKLPRRFINMIQGLLESTDPPRAHVQGPAPSLRSCHMGSRGVYVLKIT